jgi:hypothetical protein
MSTEPEGWAAPKTDWIPDDTVGHSDLNRWEGNSGAIETGERTLDPAQAPSSNKGSLRQILDWLANRIKAITGATNWHDAPATTLAAAKSHMDAAAPHSGHETPDGAQDKVDTHANKNITSSTAVHGITQGDGNGFDADKLDGKHWVNIASDIITVESKGLKRISLSTTRGHGFYLASVYIWAGTNVIHGYKVASGDVCSFWIEYTSAGNQLCLYNNTTDSFDLRYTVLEWKS